MKVKCADVCMNCANWDEEKLQKRKQQQQKPCALRSWELVNVSVMQAKLS